MTRQTKSSPRNFATCAIEMYYNCTRYQEESGRRTDADPEGGANPKTAQFARTGETGRRGTADDRGDRGRPATAPADDDAQTRGGPRGCAGGNRRVPSRDRSGDRGKRRRLEEP